MRVWLKALTTAIAGGLMATIAATAQALPIAPPTPDPVSGIPTPCPTQVAWPGDDASINEIKDQLAKNFNVKLAGNQWSETNRESIKILWETLDAVSCTSYLTDLQANVSGQVGINASSISGYAWGDWSLTRSGYVTMDFSKFQKALADDDEGRLVRLVAHELGHVRNADRGSKPDYWQDFLAVYEQEGRFSDYAGSSVTETFADVIGYYVGRCAVDNPYNSGEYDAYYEYAKEEIFGGKEFGPDPGEPLDCAVPDASAEDPMPASAEAEDTAIAEESNTSSEEPAESDGSWVEDLSEQ